ncbi:MAG: hypothetical protein ACI9FB_002074 [Candidatus Azotimanducaceae bacterium]|jgi:hypothetical protein
MRKYNFAGILLDSMNSLTTMKIVLLLIIKSMLLIPSIAWSWAHCGYIDLSESTGNSHYDSAYCEWVSGIYLKCDINFRLENAASQYDVSIHVRFADGTSVKDTGEWKGRDDWYLMYIKPPGGKVMPYRAKFKARSKGPGKSFSSGWIECHDKDKSL